MTPIESMKLLIYTNNISEITYVTWEKKYSNKNLGKVVKKYYKYLRLGFESSYFNFIGFLNKIKIKISL